MSELPRTLETEVMDTAVEAEDYDAMDHAAVNDAFCADFLALAPDTTNVLDVGTGTARIPIALVTREPRAMVVGTDLAEHMLRVARTNVSARGLDARVRLVREDAKAMTFAKGEFTAVVCNTILHHIPEPQPALAEMVRVLRPGGWLFVRDLRRPDNEAELHDLCVKHGGAPVSTAALAVSSHARQLELFRASLCASFTLDELRGALAPLGIAPSCVARTSDRHWTLAWKKPA